MKIAINALAFVAGGGITYLKNLLPELAKIDSQGRYFILIPHFQKKHESLNLPDNFEFIQIKIPGGSALRLRTLISRILYEQLILPFYLLKLKVDLLYSPGDTTCLLAPCPCVLAIRNPNPYNLHLKLPWPFWRRIRLKIQKILTFLSALKAKKIIFVSDFSRRQVVSQLKISPCKATIVYHGISPEKLTHPARPCDPKLETKLKRVRPYFLFVSTVNPHKDLETLIRAFAKLPKNLQAKYHLVIAGKIPLRSYYLKVQKLSHRLGLQNKVIFLKEVPYEQIAYVYQGASLFLFPSLLETFGHPLLEAMVMGLPIIAAASTAIPEIVGEAALVFPPGNAKCLAQLIQRVLKDEKLRNDLISQGQRRIQNFSWEKSAKKTWQVFQSTLI